MRKEKAARKRREVAGWKLAGRAGKGLSHVAEGGAEGRPGSIRGKEDPRERKCLGELSTGRRFSI